MHRFAFMWLVYSRNKFSEWVQIFQKNSFRGEPILGGSKLNVTSLRWSVFCCACLLSVILSEVGLRISNRVHNVCQAREQLTWSPVSCYMECGAVRQQEVKKIADVTAIHISLQLSSLSWRSAQIFPQPYLTKGDWCTLDVLNAIHLHKGCTLVSNKLGPISITSCTAVNMLQISFNSNFEWTCMVMRYILPACEWTCKVQIHSLLHFTQPHPRA